MDLYFGLLMLNLCNCVCVNRYTDYGYIASGLMWLPVDFSMIQAVYYVAIYGFQKIMAK